LYSKLLIAVCETSHTTHHAENVVVSGIDANTRGSAGTNGVVGDGEEESGVINTRQVASTAGLVLLRRESKRVHVDTNSRHVGVVLVGLYLVEIATLTDSESVMAVELEESGDHRVLTCHTLNTSHGVTRLERAAVPPVRVVERLLSLPGVDHSIIARHEGIALDNPDELLHGVVEVQADLVAGGIDGLRASELESLDEVLVRDLGELTTLISIEVDVVDIERGGNQVGLVDTVTHNVDVTVLGSIVPAEVLEVVELEVDTNLVVLEGDQRESQTRVAAEPELERDVESVLRGTAQKLTRAVGLTTSAVIVARLTALDDKVGEVGHVTNHLGVTSLLSRLLGELIPDVEPVTIVLVDTLTTDLELDEVDEVVANPVEPAELGTRTVSRLELYLRQGGLEVHLVDQVTITLDGTSDLVTKARVSIERVLNGLHREVGVTTINRLENKANTLPFGIFIVH
jgi:hypothetical protein